MLVTQALAEAREQALGLTGGEIVPDRHTRQNEELLRAHLDRTKVADSVNVGLAGKGRAERVAHVRGWCLADDQRSSASGELVCDVDQDDADHRARERVEAMVARPGGEAETGYGRDETGQRRTVLI